MIDQIDWARLAAFVDGEGYVAITKKSRTEKRWTWQKFDVSIRVANTDPRLPNWCRERFGGHVGVAYGKDYRHCHKPLYTWTVYGAKSKNIFQHILPYSVIKKEQIEVALAFLETMHGYRKGKYVPEEFKVKRNELFLEMKRLRTVDYAEEPASEVVN